jgi:transposase
MNEIRVLGIDLGKDICSVVGMDGAGKILLRRRMRRDTLLKLAAGIPSCIVAMEACCSAHHLGHHLRNQGNDVRLMSPEYVRPYVKAQKNDDRDAEAIAEAATRPTMRFVELKSDEQLDMQSLHRARDRLVGERTTLINQLRAILLERGIVIAKGRRRLELRLEELLSGAMTADNDNASPAIGMLNTAAGATFLRLLSAVNCTGQRVAPRKGVIYAPIVMAARPNAETSRNFL